MDPRNVLQPDPDPSETREWIESMESVVQFQGLERAHYLLGKVHEYLQVDGAQLPYLVQSPYVNTIPASLQPAYPGDLDMEKRIRRMVRWNAAVMVHRANKHFPGLGGHLSTYASAATIYEVAFNHFFRSPAHPAGGDQVYFQGHSAPGIYARAFLEGRMTEAQCLAFRREAVPNTGISSYPHPRLMPDFWQFSTVSMGLGPLAAIYQARFNRYLHHRGLKDTRNSRVWAFLGDGETDEPEALGALSLPAREGLDNLIFVVNCNLQRLDGPVRGNGKIIQELESVYSGAGWNVIKVVWGGTWDKLLAEDHEGVLRRRMDEVVDGQYQKYVTTGVDYVREDFFGKYPQLKAVGDSLSDYEVQHLKRGGHDPIKVYAAMHQATTQRNGRPTVILVKTIKGHGLGGGFAGRNTTHGQKKFDVEALAKFRDRLELPISDADLKEGALYHPGERSPEIDYLKSRRQALGGPMPVRSSDHTQIAVPGPKTWQRYLEGSGKTEVSTTGATVGVLTSLMRDKELGRHVVPILCDEGRTFGMEALFKPYGIYSALGQLYTPVDADYLLAYRESMDGQILQEGITEAGSVASFIAAGTSYSTHGVPMVPFYFFYSMFGFQRTGDSIWQAADMNARGFLIGCTAGRTTLMGEGLQHQDGHSVLLAATNPGVITYEPTYAYEVAVIVEAGLARMLSGDDVIYYLTVQNEPYLMPKLPTEQTEAVREGIRRGCYVAKPASEVGDLPDDAPTMQLLGSGSIMQFVLEAQEILVKEHGVRADVWAVTSYNELRREALAVEEANRMAKLRGPDAETSWLIDTLGATEGPILAASDWMTLVPDQLTRWLGRRLSSVGTDGFGMSDTREALRHHFGVDTPAIIEAALWRLDR
ncbi:MAG: pyruvate dehydrogenase (acetyl-transferring), homodimeric type [Myxococcales bacterium]|nr:pyruvate dehydrogenase (acetyl-transferring), homodimeric type [Myxococcales bacterium]